ncbi:MAG: hypothetical protein METHP_01815 [Methanoregula sp. SKADARSKE-2]|nr:MAG: hypothetical protein METHP_01815 [Methanoregula sp. SKADARSKE-2]
MSEAFIPPWAVTEGDRSGYTRGMAEQEIPARSI